MRCGIVVLTHRNDPHSEQKEIISPEWKRYKGEQPGTKDTKDLDYKTDLWYIAQTYNRDDLWESKSYCVTLPFLTKAEQGVAGKPWTSVLE
jgi:hypothetical protein